MKKLLILMLVLGMTSTASAVINLTWVDSGGSDISSITVVKNSTITAYLKADDASMYPSAKWIGESYTASDYAKITNITATAAAGGNPVILDKTSTYPGWWTTEAKDIESPFTVATGIQWNVTISGLELSGANYTTLDSDSYGTSDSLDVYVVPEPMTIALLGLGGLFLRRRK